MLRVDINLVFTIINLLVLYLLMKKFLFGPVVAVMEKRKAMIEEQFANAAAAEKNANELKSQYEDTLKTANADADNIIQVSFKIDGVDGKISIYKSGRFSATNLHEEERDELIQKIIQIVC